MQGAGWGGLSVSQAESVEPGASGQGGAFGPLTPAAPGVTSNGSTPADEVPSQFEYVTTEDDGNPDEVTEIGDLEAELAKEKERQAALRKEKRAVELQEQIARLRADNMAQEREIRERRKELSSASEASDRGGQDRGGPSRPVSRPTSRASRDLGRGSQGQGRQSAPKTTVDHRSQVEQLMVGLSRRRTESPTPGSSTDGPDTSDSGSGSTFSLASRDRRRGKHKLPAPSPFGIQHDQRREVRVQSGIKDKTMDTMVNKQKYPHAALQQEFLWGWNGENIDYGKLSFGLFVAGEIEIITGGSMNDNDAQCRLQMLKTTAYRAQYVYWFKLLHLHAAVLGKIESGLATWDTNFEQVERMVLENPGKVDWSARLGMRQHKSGRKSTGVDRPGNTRAVSRGDDKNITWWCRDFQSGTCQQAAPHNKNIRGREVTVQHICAKCSQKEGAERSHPDTSASCPHSDRKWQSSMHTLMPHRSAHPIVMCDWEAIDTQNEAEYLAAVASWGDLIEEVEMCPGAWASEGGHGVAGLNHEHRCKAGEDGEYARESDESEAGGVIRQVHSASEHICGSTGRFGETEEVIEGVEGMDWSFVEQDYEPDQAEGVVCVEGDEEQVCDSQEVRESARANTTCLNPHAAEFCPRPRVPMIYGPEVQRNIQLHSLVKMSGMPNFKGCRVPIKTAINVEAVKEMARDFPDQEAIEFLEFGFPISFEGMIQQTALPGNHRGARDFPEAIDDYVRKECELGATLGPFDHNPLGDYPWLYHHWTQCLNRRHLTGGSSWTCPFRRAGGSMMVLQETCFWGSHTGWDCLVRMTWWT